MDHIMEGIEEMLPVYLNNFLEEQRRNDYKTLIENPIYPELKLVMDSINLYRDFLGLPRLSLRAIVSDGLKGGR